MDDAAVETGHLHIGDQGERDSRSFPSFQPERITDRAGDSRSTASCLPDMVQEKGIVRSTAKSKRAEQGDMRLSRLT
jgi:hypothetical protein